MKRSKLLTGMLAAMIALFATACSNDENIPGTDGNGNGVITFTVNPDYGVKTRTGITLPTGKALRCIMEVYDADGNAINELKQVKSIETSTDPIEFIVDKEKAKNCTAVFWADFTNTTGADQDLYYSTASGLKAVTFNTGNTTDFNGEAFYGTAAINATGKPETTAVTLTHSIAMVTLKTTEQLKKAGSVKVTYGDTGTNANAPKSTFNALEGTTAGSTQTIEKVNKVDATKTASKDAPYDFHTFYIFAPKDTKEVINMTVEMCTDDNGQTPEQETKISNVPIRANYRTNIKGDFALAVFTISCSSDWSAGELTPPSIWDGTSGKTADASYAFSGGAGTSEDDPYIIGTATDLAQLAANVNAGTDYEDKHFKLTTDIDLNNKKWTPIGKFIDKNNANNRPFKGNFDGGHHEITNLYISTADNSIGLFGSIYNANTNGYFKNIHVSGTIIYNGSSDPQVYIGGIVGFSGDGLYSSNMNICDISGCSFNGEIDDNATREYLRHYVGGICGVADQNTILSSKNTGTITSKFDNSVVGGIVGMISDAPVSACYNTGTVTGGEYVGGIAGAPVDPKGEVHYCYNTGTVTNINTNNASAIAPDYDGNDIIDCYAVQNAADINQEILFGQNSWPTSTVGTAWYADPSNDGSENKYWKSIGGWNGGTPTYPTLWWEE